MIPNYSLDTNVIFLDFEASSLGDNSYPIEIAWCDIYGKGESYLIYNPIWLDDESLWNEKSSKIHNITKEEIMTGLTCDEIYSLILSIKDNNIFSDCTQADTYWLNRLCNFANKPKPFDFMNVYKLINAVCAMKSVPYNAVEYRSQASVECPITHRALDDCRHWAKVYRIIKGID